MRKLSLCILLAVAFCLFGVGAFAEADYAQVTARYLEADERPDALYNAVIDADGPRMWLEFHETVYGVEIVRATKIDYETFAFLETETVYQLSAVRANEGIIVQAYMPEIIPDLKISLVTARGEVLEYMLSESGEDGSAILLPSPVTSVSAAEAEGILIARFGEADRETGNTFSWGLAGETVFEGETYHHFRVSWLVTDEFGGGHLSYVGDYLVSKVDGDILLSDVNGGWTPPANASGDKWSIQAADALARRMARIAGDQVYIQTFTSDKEIIETAKKAVVIDGAKLVRAQVLDMPTDEQIRTWTNSYIGALSDDAMKETARKYPGMIVNMVNSKFGVKYVAATTILNVGDAYDAPAGFVNQIVLLDYGQDVCAFVALSLTGGRYVSANATITPAEYETVLNDTIADIGIASPIREYAY